MAINNIYRLAMIGIGPNAQELVNVFHYRQVTALGDDPGESLTVAFVTQVVPVYRLAIADDCLINKVEARNVTQPTLGHDGEIVPPVAGALVGEVLPSMSSAVISFRSGFIGRSFRGRCYVWPTVEAEQNLTQWVPAYLTLLENTANALEFLTDIVTGATYQQVVFSRKLLSSKDVIGHVVDEIVGTQQRRRPGRGS